MVSPASILAFMTAAENFPFADIRRALADPANAGNDLLALADVVALAAPFAPEAEVAAAALEGAAFLFTLSAPHPAENPIAEGQTTPPWGGWRGR